jgi:hypothetical protein
MYDEEPMTCRPEEESESLTSILARALKRIEVLEDQVKYLNAKLNTRQGRDELAIEFEQVMLMRLQNQMGRR